MDTNYILMCREAKELQEQWEPKDGDYVQYDFTELGFISVFGKMIMVNLDERGSYRIMGKQDCEWLPRQEDLQEIMLKNNKFHVEAPSFYKHTRLLDTFFMWWSKPILIEEPEDITILWLKLTMELIYNKQWNGTSWEIIQ